MKSLKQEAIASAELADKNVMEWFDEKFLCDGLTIKEQLNKMTNEKPWWAGHKLYEDFANAPLGERAQWLENVVRRAREEAVKDFAERVVGQLVREDDDTLDMAQNERAGYRNEYRKEAISLIKKEAERYTKPLIDLDEVF